MCLIHGGSSEDISRANLIHWKSNKQTLVTKSSCEAELLALVSAAETSEIIGLYNAEGMRSCSAYESLSDNTACLSLLNSTDQGTHETHESLLVRTIVGGKTTQARDPTIGIRIGAHLLLHTEEENYVPVTIKLRESPEFRKSE
eukprot:668511-Amphidinium_carterae.1